MVRPFYAAVAALFAATTVAGAEATYNTFSGCVLAVGPSAARLQIGGVDPSSQAACANLCSAGGYKICYWYGLTSICWGDTIANGARPYGSANAGPACTSSTMIITTDTTFQLGNCYTANTVSTSTTGVTYQQVTTVAYCFEACRNYLYAVAELKVTDSTISCTCTNTAPIASSAPGTCDLHSPMIYSHTPGAAASSLARRKEAARYLHQQELVASHPHCPSSYSACRISSGDSSFECIDTQYELESCGGCRYGAYGVRGNATLGQDCTQIQGVHPGGVACHHGECFVSHCRRGYKLVKGTCLRI